MGVDYYFYSEVKNKDGKWECLNRHAEKRVAATYSCSAGFISDNIDNCNCNVVNREDVSPELQDYLWEDEDGKERDPLYTNVYEIEFGQIEREYESFKKRMGYVPIDQFERAACDDEEVTVCYTVEQYLKMKNSEGKGRLMWYEWYPDADARGILGEIIAHHRWLLKDYMYVNGIWEHRDGVPETRLILNIC